MKKIIYLFMLISSVLYGQRSLYAINSHQLFREKILNLLYSQINIEEWRKATFTEGTCQNLEINDDLLEIFCPKFTIVRQDLTDNHLELRLENKRGQCVSLVIRVCDTAEESREIVLKILANILSLSSKKREPLTRITVGSPFHLGDSCAYHPKDYILFYRANVSVIFSDVGQELAVLYKKGKLIDQLIMDNLAKTAPEQPRKERITFKSAQYKPPKTAPPYKRRSPTHEDLEQKLKAMSKEQAQKYCLDMAKRLSENPDVHAEALMFYVAGLPMYEENDASRVLHRISTNAQHPQLLLSALQLQGKCLAKGAEVRQQMLADLVTMLKHHHPEIRQRAIQGLTRSHSLDALFPLLLEHQRCPDDREIIHAITKLCGLQNPQQAQQLIHAAIGFMNTVETLKNANAIKQGSKAE